MEPRVTLEINDGVADVVLNRPDKMNALDAAMFSAIIETIGRLAAHDDVDVVVLSGAGAAFCAGIDLAFLGGEAGAKQLEPRTHGVANEFQHVAWGWRSLPVPVIAALHGVVFGGGIQLALGADIRIAHPTTRLSVMEARWGLVPDMAGFPLLRDLVRGDVARELVYTGRQVEGTEAVDIGLVTRLADDPRAEALALAATIAGNSTAAVRAAKRLFALSADESTTAGDLLLAESREQQVLLASDEPRKRLSAHLRR